MGGFWTGLKAIVGISIAGAVFSALKVLFAMFVGNVTLSLNSPEGLAFIIVGAIISIYINGKVLGILWGWD